jgi:hypothetical protein
MREMKAWLMLTSVLAALATVPGDASSQSFRRLYDRGSADLVVDLSIGAESDEDKDALLYSPSELCVDPEGNILIADPLMPCVKKFDKEGRCLWTINSKGEGPGDLLTPTYLALRSDGSIIVYDIGTRRFSVFSRDGRFQNDISCSDLVWGMEVGHDDHVFVEIHAPDFDGRRGGTLVRLLRFTSDFGQSTPIDSTLVKDNIYITEPVMTNIPVPFAPRMLWHPLPSGNLVIARSKDYAIKILSPTLELLVAFERPGKRGEITDSDKEAYFGRMVGNSDGTIKKGAPAFVREKTEFPRYKPYFRELYVDDEGYFLFETYGTVADKAVYDVFDPNGRFVNELVMSELSGVSLLTQGFVYQIDAWGEGPATIKRYRIE